MQIKNKSILEEIIKKNNVINKDSKESPKKQLYNSKILLSNVNLYDSKIVKDMPSEVYYNLMNSNNLYDEDF